MYSCPDLYVVFCPDIRRGVRTCRWDAWDMYRLDYPLDCSDYRCFILCWLYLAEPSTGELIINGWDLRTPVLGESGWYSLLPGVLYCSDGFAYPVIPDNSAEINPHWASRVFRMSLMWMDEFLEWFCSHFWVWYFWYISSPTHSRAYLHQLIHETMSLKISRPHDGQDVFISLENISISSPHRGQILSESVGVFRLVTPGQRSIIVLIPWCIQIVFSMVLPSPILMNWKPSVR